jgi:hypothetical protein
MAGIRLHSRAGARGIMKTQYTLLDDRNINQSNSAISILFNTYYALYITNVAHANLTVGHTETLACRLD